MLFSKRLRPYRHSLRQRLFPGGGGFGHYHGMTELQGVETALAEPVLTLPGQIERLTGATEHKPLSREIATLRSETETHAAVRLFTYRDCLVFPNGFATRQETLGRYGALPSALLTAPVTAVPALHFCLNAVSIQYFGHWLRDAMASAFLPGITAPCHAPPSPDWPHAAQYRDMLGVAALPGQLFHAEEVIFQQDHGQGSSKRARYLAMRAALRRAQGGNGGNSGPTAAGRRVFLHRGATGSKREIAEIDTILARLQAEGFTLCDISDRSARAIHADLLDAEIVIGMEGSHLNHAQFAMKPGGLLVILMPPDRFSGAHIKIARAMGIRPGMIVLEGAGGAYSLALRDVAAMMALHAARPGQPHE
jgi:Glycosyltransferase 61